MSRRASRPKAWIARALRGAALADAVASIAGAAPAARADEPTGTTPEPTYADRPLSWWVGELPSQETTWIARAALRLFAPHDVASALAAAARSPDRDVRLTAARALADLDAQDGLVGPIDLDPLSAAIDSARADDAELRSTCLRAFGRWAHVAKPSVAVALQLIDGGEAAGGISMLERVPPPAAGVAPALAMLVRATTPANDTGSGRGSARDERPRFDANVRARALLLLSDLDEEARPFLSVALDALDSREPRESRESTVRKAAMQMASRLAPDDPRVVDAVFRGLRDRDPDVVAVAGAGLVRCAKASASVRSSLRGDLRHADPVARLRALRTLVEVEPTDPALVDAAVAGLSDADRGVRSTARAALASLGDAAARAIPAMMAVKEPPTDLLHSLGPKHPAEVIAGMRSATDSVRHAALRILEATPSDALAAHVGALADLVLALAPASADAPAAGLPISALLRAAAAASRTEPSESAIEAVLRVARGLPAPTAVAAGPAHDPNFVASVGANGSSEFSDTVLVAVIGDEAVPVARRLAAMTARRLGEIRSRPAAAALRGALVAVARGQHGADSRLVAMAVRVLSWETPFSAEFRRLLADPSPTVRRLAIESAVVGPWGSGARLDGERLAVPMLDDADGDVRLRAAEIVRRSWVLVQRDPTLARRLGSVVSANLVAREARTTDETAVARDAVEGRLAALDAVRDLSLPAVEALPIVERMSVLDPSPLVRQRARTVARLLRHAIAAWEWTHMDVAQ